MAVLPSLHDHVDRASEIENTHRIQPDGSFFRRVGFYCVGAALVVAAAGIWVFPAIDGAMLLVKLGVSVAMLGGGFALVGAR